MCLRIAHAIQTKADRELLVGGILDFGCRTWPEELQQGFGACDFGSGLHVCVWDCQEVVWLIAQTDIMVRYAKYAICMKMSKKPGSKALSLWPFWLAAGGLSC